MEYIERIGGIEKKFVGTIGEIITLKNGLEGKITTPSNSGSWIYNNASHLWECAEK